MVIMTTTILPVPLFPLPDGREGRNGLIANVLDIVGCFYFAYLLDYKRVDKLLSED